MNLTALVKTTARGSRWFRAAAVVLLVGALLALPAAPSGASSPDDEAAFVALINNLRRSHGLNALVVDPELTAQARRWTDVMAADDQLKHAGDLSSGISARWDLLGENVGVHTVHDVNGLFQAFVASPHHLENLLDPRFEYVGVGVTVTPSGKVWTTHRFMSVPSAPAPAPPPPPAPTTTAPPPPPPPPPPAPAPTAAPTPATAAPAPAPPPATSAPRPTVPAPAPAPTSTPTTPATEGAPEPTPAPDPVDDDPGPSPDALAAGAAPAVADAPESTVQQLAFAAALGVTVAADQQTDTADASHGRGLDGQPFSNDPFDRDPFDVRPLVALLLDGAATPD